MNNERKEQMRAIINIKRAQRNIKLFTAKKAYIIAMNEDERLESDIQDEKEIFNILSNEKLSQQEKDAQIAHVNKYRYDDIADADVSYEDQQIEMTQERLDKLLEKTGIDGNLSLTEMINTIGDTSDQGDKEDGYAATNQQREDAKQQVAIAKANQVKSLIGMIEAQRDMRVTTAKLEYSESVSRTCEFAGREKTMNMEIASAKLFLQQSLDAAESEYNTAMMGLEN